MLFNLLHMSDEVLQLVHVTGNPWVILGPPRPNPHETHTRSHRSRFIQVWVWVPVTSHHCHHITCHRTQQPTCPLTSTPPLPTTTVMTMQHDVANTTTTPTTTWQQNEGGWAATPIPNNRHVFLKIYSLIVLTNFWIFAGTTMWRGGFPPPRHVIRYFWCGERRGKTLLVTPNINAAASNTANTHVPPSLETRDGGDIYFPTPLPCSKRTTNSIRAHTVTL